MLAHEVFGDKLLDPPKMKEYLPPDVKNLPLAHQEAIAEMCYNNIMCMTDGKNFSPDVTFNRAQNSVVTGNLFDAVSAVKGESIMESNPSPAP